jgi:hypothetical protein
VTKRRALPIVLSLLTVGSANAAEKITLACSGTLFLPSANPAHMTVPDQLIVIDLGRSIVTSSIGEYKGRSFGELRILETTENRISFKGVDENGDNVVGGVNRYSGSTGLATWHNDQMVQSYQLTCKPANPLF